MFLYKKNISYYKNMICYNFLLFIFFMISFSFNFCKNNENNKDNVKKNENIVKNNGNIIKNNDNEKDKNNLNNNLNIKNNINNINKNKDHNDKKNSEDSEKTLDGLMRNQKDLKNNKDKKDIKTIDDLLFLDDDYEKDFKDLFGDDDLLFLNNNKLNGLIDIPISLSFYISLLNYNLDCIDKNHKNDFFSKKIFNLNFSTLILYKFTRLHKKMWNSFLNKKPENKVLIYIRDHFIPKLGLYFEKGVYNNYYSYKIKSDKDTKSNFKDFETIVGIPILRLGPVIQFTWLKDEAGMLNASFIFSCGWQTNLYSLGCCCVHNKNIWLYVNSDFTGINSIGVNNYAKKINDFNLKNYYLMLHFEFGFYFIKVFTRFYSPLSNSNNTSFSFLDLFKDDGCEIRDNKDNEIKKDTTKKLNFNKWTMSWGFSLSL